jgi:hypothetical protein
MPVVSEQDSCFFAISGFESTTVHKRWSRATDNRGSLSVRYPPASKPGRRYTVFLRRMADSGRGRARIPNHLRHHRGHPLTEQTVTCRTRGQTVREANSTRVRYPAHSRLKPDIARYPLSADTVAKVESCNGLNFLARTRNATRSMIRIASVALPKSPMSLA